LEGDSEYYFCPSCGAASIINFESAATVEFRCERCNRLLEFIDEKKLNELYEK
jgi:transcription initiation factor IIE alpha subunit